MARQVVIETVAGLAIETCPSCLQSLAAVETPPGLCLVCHQPTNTVPNDPIEHKTRLEILADKQRDTEKALAYLQEDLTQLRETRESLLAAKRLKENVLNEQAADLVAPFLSELELLYQKAQSLDIEEEALEAKVRAYNQLKSYRSEIHALETKIITTQQTLKDLKELMETHLRKYTQVMNTALREFSVGSVFPQAVTFEIDPTHLVPLVNGKPVDAIKSASDKVVARLGLFFGILAVAVLTKAKHPKLLLLDSPRDKDMDFDKFKAIAKRFIDLVQSAPVDCQLFITTSQMTPDMEPFLFFQTEDIDGQRLLRKIRQ